MKLVEQEENCEEHGNKRDKLEVVLERTFPTGKVYPQFAEVNNRWRRATT